MNVFWTVDAQYLDYSSSFQVSVFEVRLGGPVLPTFWYVWSEKAKMFPTREEALEAFSRWSGQHKENFTGIRLVCHRSTEIPNCPKIMSYGQDWATTSEPIS